MTTTTLAELWKGFADTSCRGYSPLYDRICRAVADDDEILAMVEVAPPRAHLPNVLLAAVHYLLLGGLDHPLAAVYEGSSDLDPGPLFTDVCRAQREAIGELLQTRHTNTNEVGRSALLGPALTATAGRIGEPLALVDVGCSAGLNLLCDRYRLDFGPCGATGPEDAAVRISCRVVGGRPPIAPLLPRIAARVGLDRDPIDLFDEDAVRWQLACVWPDTGRLPRSRLAFEEARRSPPRIVRGDAVDALPELVASLPDGCVPVIVTTWSLAYLDRRRRAEFQETLASLGRRAPLAWISGEGAGVVEPFAAADAPLDADGTVASVLGSVVFRGGEVDATLLGFAHAHGAWIDWRGPEQR